MLTNTSEAGFETLIVNWLVKQSGFEQGAGADYNREYAVDESRLFRFLENTQAEQIDLLGIKKSRQKYTLFLKVWAIWRKIYRDSLRSPESL